MGTFLRRCLTIPAVLLVTALLTVLLPLWLPLTALAAVLLPAARSAPRAVGFMLAYLWCEVAGIAASLVIGLRFLGRRSDAAFAEANYRLQSWWCRALKRSAERLFRLRFEVEGSDVLGGTGVIFMARHCSIGDTLLPVVFYADVIGRRLRFVLKRELLLDPCLDIVGNRLPNYFADRNSENTAREVANVAALVADLPEDHGVLIYPEGTRFSPEKRARILERLEAKGEQATLDRARQWTRVLPPRFGGPLALLAANPGRDLVFCAHTGFEGSANFARLLNGGWLDTVVRLRFWRVPFAEIPTDPAARRTFLLEQWDRMQREVDALAASDTVP